MAEEKKVSYVWPLILVVVVLAIIILLVSGVVLYRQYQNVGSDGLDDAGDNAQTEASGTDTGSDGAMQAVCADGIDNDIDGFIDANDWGCQEGNVEDFWDFSSECFDGEDNDNNDFSDQADPNCDSVSDSTENPSSGGSTSGGSGSNADGSSTDSGEDDECGNDIEEGDEECDDGNTQTEQCDYGQTSCPVCDSNCNEVSGETDYCGDGTVDSSEQCDDGDLDNNDGCSSVCTNEVVQTCVLVSAAWSSNSVPPNTAVDLIVTGNGNCFELGHVVKLDIYSVGSQTVLNTASQVTFNSADIAQATWSAAGSSNENDLTQLNGLLIPLILQFSLLCVIIGTRRGFATKLAYGVAITILMIIIVGILAVVYLSEDMVNLTPIGSDSYYFVASVEGANPPIQKQSGNLLVYDGGDPDVETETATS